MKSQSHPGKEEEGMAFWAEGLAWAKPCGGAERDLCEELREGRRVGAWMGREVCRQQAGA